MKQPTVVPHLPPQTVLANVTGLPILSLLFWYTMVDSMHLVAFNGVPWARYPPYLSRCNLPGIIIPPTTQYSTIQYSWSSCTGLDLWNSKDDFTWNPPYWKRIGTTCILDCVLKQNMLLLCIQFIYPNQYVPPYFLHTGYIQVAFKNHSIKVDETIRVPVVLPGPS